MEPLLLYIARDLILNNPRNGSEYVVYQFLLLCRAHTFLLFLLLLPNFFHENISVQLTILVGDIHSMVTFSAVDNLYMNRRVVVVD